MKENNNPSQHNVVVLGASNKSDRYSNMAIKLLLQHHYSVIPVHPKLESIEGLKVVHTLSEIHFPVNTLTMYVGDDRSKKLISDIKAMRPERVIFNPGSESDELEAALRECGVEVVHGCTLVMLKTGTF